MSDIEWCNDEKCFIKNQHRHIEERVIEFGPQKPESEKFVVTSYKVQFSEEDPKP